MNRIGKTTLSTQSAKMRKIPDSAQADFVQRHSLFGIVSTAMGMFSILSMCSGLTAILTCALTETNNDWAVVSVLSLWACGAPVSLVGAGLGIGGCFQTERQKPFAVLGTVINCGMLLAYLYGMLVFSVMTLSRV